MGMFNVSISTIVKRFGDRISFLQPMIEAISNSLEAHAEHINVKLYTDKNNTLVENNKIYSYEIEDNGEGFTEENQNSFLTYMSEHKLKIGCKGVGRITWLKVFKRVNVESHTKNQDILFIFDEDFSKEKILKEQKNNKHTKTIIKFDDPRSEYNQIGRTHTQIDADVNLIRNFIEENLLVKLTLLNSQDIKFNITVSDEQKNYSMPISNNNLRILKQKDFYITDNRGTEIPFRIFYYFYDNIKNKRCNYFCANGRTVCKISENISFSELPNDNSSILLVTSNFLDEHVKNDRNEFDIPNNENTLNYGLSWEKINFNLKNIIDNILIEEFPNIEKENKQKISELIESHPYLTPFILEETSKIINKEKTLSHAKQRFEKKKEEISHKFKFFLDQNELDSEDFYKSLEEVTSISSLELAEYIVFRQQIIYALKRIDKRNEKCEKIIHNLFMKMRTESYNDSHFDNNLWLFDDKFMTYIYAASDLTISKIKSFLDKNIDNIKSKKRRNEKYRPDMAVFFSRDEKNPEKKDAIIIEFKACGAPDLEKSKATIELNRNAYSLRKNIPNINDVWCYAITKFTEDFIDTLLSEDFKPLFTTNSKNELYYRYYDQPRAHCYYMSLEALINDAEARNKIFIDIIKNKNK